jgi:pyruvate, water dikinase
MVSAIRWYQMEVLWLGHLDCHDVNRVSAKAAHLSRLVASYRIPPGFCVTAAAYAQWAACPGRSHPALAPQARPAGLYNALASAYRGLATRCGVADPGVAVRSSAVDEDGATPLLTSASSKTFASFRSAVSNPSVNQP